SRRTFRRLDHDAAEEFEGCAALTMGPPHTNGIVRLPTSTVGTAIRTASVPRVPVPPLEAMTATAPDRRAYRLTSIDMLRGLVIVIMALDHVRDFVMAGSVQDPLSNPDVAPSLFMTRWITHICAPVFVFLAGTSAGLMTTRKSPASLAGFLAKRGFWLIL